MTIKGSDALGYDEATEKGFDLLIKGDKFGFLIICGVNFGLRISDLLKLTYDDLKSYEFIIGEQKTGKRRKLVVNDAVKAALSYMSKIDPVRYHLGGKIFVSQKGTVYSSQHVNRKLKTIFDTDRRKISSHSLRKCFGKRLYEKSEQNIALVQLQLRHSSPAVTLDYIGVTQDNLDECFNMIL